MKKSQEEIISAWMALILIPVILIAIVYMAYLSWKNPKEPVYRDYEYVCSEQGGIVIKSGSNGLFSGYSENCWKGNGYIKVETRQDYVLK